MDREDSPVRELVGAARDGQQSAWDELVARYTPLVVSVIRGYRLQSSDAEDVAQTVWLRLVEHLDEIREPQALPGWIVTTTRNECLRTIRLRQRAQPFDPLAATGAARAADAVQASRSVFTEVSVVDDMARAARHEALLQAFAGLSTLQRELLLLLMTDPPIPYAEVGRRLGMPVGSIGPTRARALERIRRHPAVATSLAQSTAAEGREVRRPS